MPLVIYEAIFRKVKNCVTKWYRKLDSFLLLISEQEEKLWLTYPVNVNFNPLNAELNPICYSLALLGAHHFLQVSRIRVKSLTLRLLMSCIYIYMEHLFLMFLDHTQRRTTVGRTSLDEWSARRRDLYLTTHDTHNRQISMPPVGFEPKISAGKRPQAAYLLRSNPTGHGYLSVVSVVCCQVEVSTTSWSLVQRSTTVCGASLCVI